MLTKCFCFRRAATSIQRFYRFYKYRTKSRVEVLPPPTSPFNPPVHEAYENSHVYKHEESTEDPTQAVEQLDSDSQHKPRRYSHSHVPVVNYVSLGEAECSSSGQLTRNKTSTNTSKTSTEQSKGSLDSTDVRSGDVNYSRMNVNIREHSSRSLAKTTHSHEPNSYEQSYQALFAPDGVNNGQNKVMRRMTIDLVKLESSTIGTIESATCGFSVSSGLRLGKHIKALFLCISRAWVDNFPTTTGICASTVPHVM